MSKERDVDGGSTEKAVRWHLRFLEADVSSLSLEELIEWVAWSAEPGHLQKFRDVKRVWEVCGAPFLRTALPTDAEIAGDKYDGSVPMSEWLAPRSRDSGVVSRHTSFLILQRLCRSKMAALAASLMTIAIALGLHHDVLWDVLSADSRT